MNTALLIIDVQESLIDEGIWNSDIIISRLNQLIATARKDHIPIIFVRDKRIEPNGELHNSLNHETNDLEIEKCFCDSFVGTQLDEILKSKSINKLVVGGMQTDFCVDTTCRQAAALGYDVLLVADAHSTLDHEYLKAEQIVAHHNRILRSLDSAQGRVRVSDTAEVSFI